HPARIREADRGLGDAGHAVPRVVSSVQQARPRRRAERGRVKLGVPGTVGGEPVDVRRLERAAIAPAGREADVVENDVDDARRTLRRARCLERAPIRLRVANVNTYDTTELLSHLATSE